MLFHIAADLSSQRLRSAAPSNQDPLGVENQFTYAVKPDLSLKNRESRRMAKPIIVVVYGSDAWLRSRRNSDSIVGITVTIDHIPTLPTEAIKKITNNLAQESLLSVLSKDQT